MNFHISEVEDRHPNLKTIFNILMISETEERKPDQKAENIRLILDDREVVYRQEMMDIYDERKRRDKKQLIGYVIVLERIFG
ncbi:MAG: hypothetical protein HC880_19190 [Bacteroidia bacterium]|nr:hypothetical protein [Bacteroidia bacterium]